MKPPIKSLTGALAALLASSVLLSGCSAAAAAPTASAVPSTAEAEYAHLFSDQDIMEISIEIDEADWQDILDNPAEEAYHEASVTVNGVTVSGAGIRTKGNSSLNAVASSDSDRYGFRVKLDKYADGQTLEGLDEFVLNANYADPSYMREYLTYLAMAELGGITPYLSYCNLTVNGELFGFYLCIEAMDDSFVERLTAAADAQLYKADGEQCTLLESMALDQFESKYGDDEGLSHIQELVSLLAQDTLTQTEIEALVDVDSVLRAMAVNTVMGNYDSYSGSLAHNYYLLYANGTFTYIGWDYNMSIDGFTQGGSDSIIADISTPVFGTTLDSRPLYQRLLEQDAYRERYLAYVTQLTDYFGDFEQEVTALAQLITPYVQADPTAFYTYEQFVSNTTASGTDLTASVGQTDAQTPDGTAPEGQTPPDGVTGATPDDTAAQPPDGAAAPTEDTAPSTGEQGAGGFPDRGQMPGGGQGGGQFGAGRGGGSISSVPVSIVDYITQRVTIVKAQLDGTYTGQLSTGSSGGRGGQFGN